MPQQTFTSIIIGSGFSGLAMAIKLKEKGIQDFIVLEKAGDIGGTWRENTYPGAECDIPSALYSYSFEPYPHWEYKWSMQPQILKYIHYVVDKYKLRHHIQFNQEFKSAEWDGDNAQWILKTKSGESFVSKTIISAIGQLHHPSMPRIDGMADFQGDSWHSAKWNHNISLENKTVGVIGNAASAVQFIPEIAKVAKQVTIFQRSANWMLPKQDRAYNNWEKKLVARLPFILKLYRLKLWLLGGALFTLMKTGNNYLRNIYEKKTINYIKEHITDPAIVKSLIPTYPFGAKRALFSDTYYAALAKENVTLVSGGLEKINTLSVSSNNNTEHPIDILIYATGFITNPFLLGIDIKGKNGLKLADHWKDGPKNYLGISVDQFPNLFMMYGPNTNLGHNSIILMSEAQANYIAQCIKLLDDTKWNSIEVKVDVIDKHHHETQERLENMIWASIDKSWYKSEGGNIPNNYPGRTMEYSQKTKKVNFDDYDLS